MSPWRGWGFVAFLFSRLVRSRSSKGFVSFIASVSVLGIALGVLALIVVTSAVNGFEGELARVIAGKNGDVILYTRADAIDDPPAVIEKVKKTAPEVNSGTAAFVAQVMVSGANGVFGALLEGVDLATVSQVTDLPNQLIKGRLPQVDDEVGLGSALAQKLGVEVGGTVRLVTPYSGTSEGIQGAPRSSAKRVVGIVSYGMYDYDSKYIFGTLAGVQTFLGQAGKATAFKFKVKSGASAQLVADRLSETFGYPFRAKYWGQLNKNIFYAIQLEKAVISILLASIIVVAAFNMVSALMMLIHEKSRDLAILKAMGLSHSKVFALFFAFGLVFGSIGVVMGLFGGLAVNGLLSRFQLIQIPSDIYYISFLPVVVRWNEVFGICTLALAVALVATIYPAVRVTRQSPLDGIRYE